MFFVRALRFWNALEINYYYYYYYYYCYLSFLILFVLTEYRFLIFIKYNNLINFLVLADNKLFASVQYLFCVIAVI